MQNSIVLHWLVQVLHPPQKSERPPFLNGRIAVHPADIKLQFKLVKFAIIIGFTNS
jgi:hypothetical protein